MGTEMHSRSNAPDIARRAPDGAASDSAAGPAPVAPVPLSTKPIVVGSVHDPAEAEADRMADAALERLRRRQTEDTRDGSDHDHGHHQTPARRAPAPSASGAIGAAGGPVGGDVEARLDGTRGRGGALPGGTRGRMEQAFGRNLGHVRVHTDTTAGDLAASVSARAFTVGSDIYFARDEFRPESPDGERMLAHEVAHTLQSGSDGVHRWPFGKDKDPAEKKREEEEKAAKKKAKSDAAEEKKKKKEEDAAKAKLRKVTAKENKKLESGEKKQLAQERKVGVKQREELAQKIAQESKADKTTSATQADLHERFDKQLALEKATFEEMVDQGADVEEARDKAYEVAWLKADPDLRSVRPPRETASERLVYEVHHMRAEDKLDDEMLERGRLGKMLPKGVELVYEQWELEAERLRAGKPPVAPETADYLAGKTVWAQASPEIQKKRPTDPRIERQARIDARTRLQVGRRGPKKDDSKLDTAGEVTENLEKFGGKVIGAGTAPPKKILEMIGKPIDKQMRADAGLEVHDKTFAERLPIIGEPMERVHYGQKNDVKTELPTSKETRASEGIGACAEILTDLLESVNGVMKMAKSVTVAATETTTHTVLGAAKSCNDGAKTAANMAAHAAELAKVIDPGVTEAVASFVPGLNIGIAVLGIVSNSIRLADQSVRMAETNQSLTDARGRTPGAKKVDVMVYPLWHVHEVHSKKLEQATWSTAIAISSLVTSIATVASGGGYGIPTAVQAGVKVVDLLHTLSHFIADQVIVAIAKQARVDSLEKLEGAAENQLKKDPAMAVDAIYVRAKKGDQVAIKFLSTYRVKEEEIKTGKPMEIRQKVLEQIGEDADPAYAYEGFVSKMGKFWDTMKSVGGRWESTGELAKERNKLDGDDAKRGWGWRVKMMFKGKEKYERSKSKTAAISGQNADIECRVGKVFLLKDADASEIGQFVDQVEKLSDNEVLNATADPDNSPEWREILVELMQVRIEKASKEKAKATAGA